MLSWLWGVFLFPYLGPLAYFIWGSERLYRRRLRKRTSAANRRDKVKELQLPNNFSAREQGLGKLLSQINIYPSSLYTNAEILLDAASFYPALAKEIQNARESIWIEFYIWKNDRWGNYFLQLLIEAAQRGVSVSLILDEIGCLGLSQKFFDPLKQAGGKFTWFNSIDMIQNRWTFALRNHRKLQIIDGKIAFVGGMNIGCEYAGEDPVSGTWRDIQLMIEGPVLSSLQETFLEDWHFATGETLTYSQKEFPESSPSENWIQVVDNGPDSPEQYMTLSMLALLHYSTERVWIAAGYFIPHEPLISAMKLCASRGVDVRILVAEASDHPYLVISARSYYEELLTYGIKIYEYSRGTHHAKAILVDEDICSIGSANMDIRSMRLNFELNLFFKSSEKAKYLEEIFEEDFKNSTQISLKTFLKRSIFEQMKENILRLIAPLL